MRPGDRFRKLQARLRNSRLIVLDERSMIGRMFVGKIVSRVREFLGDGTGPPGTTLGGQDLLMIGDDKQCAPIGDEPQYQEGAYTGKAKGVEDGPRPDALVGMGLLLRFWVLFSFWVWLSVLGGVFGIWVRQCTIQSRSTQI